jgi:hypothetical protein
MLDKVKILIEERNRKDQDIIEKFKENLEKEISHTILSEGEEVIKADLRIKHRKNILIILNESEYIIEELIKEKNFYIRFLVEQRLWMSYTSSVLGNLFNTLYAEVIAQIITELNSIIDDLLLK